MRIVAVTAFAQWQPFVDGVYTCSGGRSATGFDSTVVRLDTDAGCVGWGEMAPLGAFYDPSFADGARAALNVLAPVLIGADPRSPAAIHRSMDLALAGHPYAKSALDMSCWDLAAQASGLPLAELLGGRCTDGTELYRSIAQMAPEQMAERARSYLDAGYRRLQVKVGLDPIDDVERMEAVTDAAPGVVLYADANAAWQPAQARRFLRATRHLDYVLEQPCAGYEANAALRSMCDRPLVLDETIDSLAVLLRAHHDGLVDGVTLKIARLGGITPTRLIRDVATELGLQVTVEDTGGAEIDTAAMAHLSASTPDGARTHTVDFHRWVSVSQGVADFGTDPSRLAAPTCPGLGVAVDESTLGHAIGRWH